MKNSTKSWNRFIRINKVRENNLKNLSLSIPKNAFVLVTGRSGSGKSTLIHQVIGSEARRRYLEQLNPKVRSLMAGIKRPELDGIQGLSPVVSLDQKPISLNLRSTVGTLSEIYDHFRLLFSRYGECIQNSELALSRSHFSFNQKEGACQHCNGIGNEEFIDPSLFVLDSSKSIRDGAISLTTPTGYIIYSQVTLEVLESVCAAEGFSLDIPFEDFTKSQLDVLYYGSDAIKVPFGKHTLESRMKWTGITAKPRDEGYFRGILTIMEEILKRDRNKNILKYTRSRTCPQCNGYRLNQSSLSMTWQGMHIGQWASLAVDEINISLNKVLINEDLSAGEKEVVIAIAKYLDAFEKLGIGHLSLNRESKSLSRGEAKRIQLSSLIRPEMAGLLYTLDEPTVGLHPADHNNLLDLLKEVQLNGNTVLCIDHKLFGFTRADYWLEIGPGAGKEGGRMLVDGWMNDLLKEKTALENSATWPYLTGKKRLSRTLADNAKSTQLKFRKANFNNLKNIDPIFYTKALNVICGVSGAGKSTLLDRVIFEALTSTDGITKHGEMISDVKFKRVLKVNQEPIGRTPRSNPLTYIKLFDKIRDLFADLPESKELSYTKSHFSFNVEGGRCQKCKGAGKIELGLSYLGRIETACDECMGKRFNSEVLKVKYRGLSISQILDLEVKTACEFFEDLPDIAFSLNLLNDLGLGYLHLGQSSSTLSGGEAQRIKLVAELVKGRGSNNIYLLDEPSNGLHYDDIQVLLKGFDKLIEQGGTLIIVDHDPFLIDQCDWMVELGPKAGQEGGEIIFMGSPKDLKPGNSLMATAIGNAKSFDVGSLKPRPYEYPSFNMELKGINTNNLKDIQISLPTNKIIAITGMSGSGKTSLAFDSVYEQSRYLYSQIFSTYIRTLIGGNKPINVEETSHLLPAIGINYRIAPGNNMSTVGSLLGAIAIVRLLFARFSKDPDGNICQLWAKHFSYMDSSGACTECEGHGFILTSNESSIVSNPGLSIANGALSVSKPGRFFSDPNGQYYAVFLQVCEYFEINPESSWRELNEDQKKLILYGCGAQEFNVLWKYKRKDRIGEHKFISVWKGFVNLINEDYHKKKGSTRTAGFTDVMVETNCPCCFGHRLSPDRQKYELFGQNIKYWSSQPIDELKEFVIKAKNNHLGRYSGEVSHFISELLDHLAGMLTRVENLGLGYLSLIRRANTLSSGEYQRVRLLGQIASGLSGILYIIDEPGASLHQNNMAAVYQLFRELRDQGNSIIFTDHRPELIDKSDYLLELGPGAGSEGGQIIYEGIPSKKIIELRREEEITINHSFLANNYILSLEEIKFRNINISKLNIPKGWVSVSGVSGSGKSTLINSIILKAFKGTLENSNGLVTYRDTSYTVTSPTESVRSWNWTKTPAKCLGLDQIIYKEVAKCDRAKSDAVTSNDFKPGSKKFACKTCLSKGQITESLDFLGQSLKICPQCKGTGYNTGISVYKVHGLSLDELLRMEINSLWDYLPESKIIDSIRMVVNDLGIAYLLANQHGDLLSEGEKQRLFLASTLLVKNLEPHLFLFDEPTRGLDTKNREGFTKLLKRLVDQGHSIITIDHDSMLIKRADWNIQLGPGAGADGGLVVYEGVP